jgi:tRNA (guanine37-N1)-methyltransferase
MQFDIITIFPDFFDSFVSESLIKKAQEKGLIKINVHDLREYAPDRHQTVDDRPFGGGIGMVMKIEPIYQAIKKIKKNKNKKSKVIIFTPRARTFNQKKATDFSELDQLVMICGRYEGIDERVAKYLVDEKLSIGNYVLFGGELAAMVVIEAVSRLIPGVIGKPALLDQRVTKDKRFVEYPQYTRPEVFEPEPGKKWKVPKVLLSGHHQRIEEWRKKHSRKV